MTRYAAQTSVSVEKSRAEVEETVRRYGADGYRHGWGDRDGKRIEQIKFSASNRHVRFTLLMPSKDDLEFMYTPVRADTRSKNEQLKAWEQACRQRWRALNLAIKAKLEAVECGISEFEDEFLAHIVDPETGLTMNQIIRPQIAQRYAGADVRIGLPGLPSPEEFADSETL